MRNLISIAVPFGLLGCVSSVTEQHERRDGLWPSFFEGYAVDCREFAPTCREVALYSVHGEDWADAPFEATHTCPDDQLVLQIEASASVGYEDLCDVWSAAKARARANGLWMPQDRLGVAIRPDPDVTVQKAPLPPAPDTRFVFSFPDTGPPSTERLMAHASAFLHEMFHVEQMRYMTEREHFSFAQEVAANVAAFCLISDHIRYEHLGAAAGVSNGLTDDQIDILRTVIEASSVEKPDRWLLPHDMAVALFLLDPELLRTSRRDGGFCPAPTDDADAALAAYLHALNELLE